MFDDVLIGTFCIPCCQEDRCRTSDRVLSCGKNSGEGNVEPARDGKTIVGHDELVLEEISRARGADFANIACMGQKIPRDAFQWSTSSRLKLCRS